MAAIQNYLRVTKIEAKSTMRVGGGELKIKGRHTFLP